MRRAASLLVVLATLGAAMSAAGAVATVAPSPRSTEYRPGMAASADYVPGEVLVKYRRSVESSGRMAVRSVANLQVKTRIPQFATEVLRTPAGASVPATVARLSRDPRVKSVEPNYILRPMGVAVPNDPEYTDLWGFSNTGQNHDTTDGGPEAGTVDADADVFEAWATTQGDQETVIAVIDSGVDVAHPDLAANIWENPDDPPGGGDDDGNGLVDDVNGWDFAENDDSLLDPNKDSNLGVVGTAHGTHVAGTIAAEGDNNTGVIGVCPNCKVMVLKFMKPVDTRPGLPGTDEMLGSVAAELKALAYAKSHEVDVVNGSYGSSAYSEQQRAALAGLKRKGVLGVFAAGNSALDNDIGLLDNRGRPVSPNYPSSYELPGIVSVGASNHRDQYGYFTGCAEQETRNFCSMSNFGDEAVDLVAPGIDIESTIPTQENSDYDVYNGTSMASPFVAGIAGLLKSDDPFLSPMQIKGKLMRGVDKPSTLHRVYSALLNSSSNIGWPGVWNRTDGRVNAVEALTASSNPVTLRDGSIRGARRIESSQKGSLVWGGDTNDVYSRRLEEGETYKVTLNGPPLDSGEEDFSMDLYVWRPGTKDLWQLSKLFRAGGRSGGINSNDEVVKFMAPRDGKFFFQVSSFLSLKYNYTLKFERVFK